MRRSIWISGAGFITTSSTANPRAATNFLSCSRASIGYAKNADGTLTQFANDTLRITIVTDCWWKMRERMLSFSQDLLTLTGMQAV